VFSQILSEFTRMHTDQESRQDSTHRSDLKHFHTAALARTGSRWSFIPAALALCLFLYDCVLPRRSVKISCVYCHLSDEYAFRRLSLNHVLDFFYQLFRRVLRIGRVSRSLLPPANSQPQRCRIPSPQICVYMKERLWLITINLEHMQHRHVNCLPRQYLYLCECR
jgi:hypothetical protein